MERHARARNGSERRCRPLSRLISWGGGVVLALCFAASALSCSRQENGLSASGTIEAIEVRVSATTQGRLLETSAEEGSAVEEGAQLAVVDDEYYRFQAGLAAAGVELASAQLALLTHGARSEDLAQARSALASADKTLSLAKDDAERMAGLEASGAATRRQKEEADARLSSATAARDAAAQALNKLQSYARPEELKAAEAKVEQAKWNARLADKSLNDCRILAPVAGIVTSRLSETGELVAPGTGIAIISDLSRLSLKIYLPEAAIGKVTLGEKAAVSVDSFPGRIFPGTVAFISPQAEFTPKNVQTKDERTKLVYAVKLDLGDGAGLLKPGMPADAVLGE